jgi:hypothetical protein
MLLIAWDFIERYRMKFLSKLGISYIVLFGYFIYFELSCWNMPYDEYMIRVGNRLLNNVGHISALIIIFIIIYTAWERHDILKQFLDKIFHKNYKT